MGNLHEFTFLSVLLRMVLAMACGAVIGYGRTKKNRTAGFRTFMITSIGACLTMLLSLYEYEMLKGAWAPAVEASGMKFDGSRFSAQVISGVGFLAAGSIIAVEHKQVEGLTTATGLFASVCMGIACGAGFYACVFAALIMIFVTLEALEPLEVLYKRRRRNITFYVEFDHMESLQKIIEVLKNRESSIYSIDVERMHKEGDDYPAAVFSVRLGKGYASHSETLSLIAQMPLVYRIEELIA